MTAGSVFQQTTIRRDGRPWRTDDRSNGKTTTRMNINECSKTEKRKDTRNARRKDTRNTLKKMNRTEALIKQMREEPETVKKISFCNYPFTVEEFDLLLGVMKIASLEKIILAYNQDTLNEEQLLAILDSINRHPSLRRLVLSKNLFTDRVVERLASVLSQNKVVQRIQLCGNQLNGLRLGTILNSLNKNVIQLNLRGNLIGDDDYLTIAQYLKKSNLKRLYLQGNQITASGIEPIAQVLSINDKLDTLDLNCNRLADQGVEILAKSLEVNSVLRRLNLAKNEITDQSMTSIAQLLMTNDRLSLLCLRNNLITDQGIKTLVPGLKVNTTLTNIRLGFNRFTEEGNKMIIEMLNYNYSLFSVFINRYDVDQEKINQLLSREERMKRRNKYESLQQKCARLIKLKKLNCSVIPPIVKERFLLK